MALLKMLQFLVLIIVHDLILIIQKNNLLVLCERPVDGVSGKTDEVEKKFVFTSVTQRQDFASVYIIMI